MIDGIIGIVGLLGTLLLIGMLIWLGALFVEWINPYDDKRNRD